MNGDGDKRSSYPEAGSRGWKKIISKPCSVQKPCWPSLHDSESFFPARTAPSSRYGPDTVRFVCKIRHLFYTAQTLSKKITEKLSFFFVFKVINVKYLSSTTFSLSMCTKFATEGNKTERQAINQNRIICFIYLRFVGFIYFMSSKQRRPSLPNRNDRKNGTADKKSCTAVEKIRSVRAEMGKRHEKRRNIRGAIPIFRPCNTKIQQNRPFCKFILTFI